MCIMVARMFPHCGHEHREKLKPCASPIVCNKTGFELHHELYLGFCFTCVASKRGEQEYQVPAQAPTWVKIQESFVQQAAVVEENLDTYARFLAEWWHGILIQACADAVEEIPLEIRLRTFFWETSDKFDLKPDLKESAKSEESAEDVRAWNVAKALRQATSLLITTKEMKAIEKGKAAVYQHKQLMRERQRRFQANIFDSYLHVAPYSADDAERRASIGMAYLLRRYDAILQRVPDLSEEISVFMLATQLLVIPIALDTGLPDSCIESVLSKFETAFVPQTAYNAVLCQSSGVEDVGAMELARRLVGHLILTRTYEGAVKALKEQGQDIRALARELLQGQITSCTENVHEVIPTI
ncbi:hypothetical protein GQ53DRAFT_768188 [Thozetella sp. PMI_491]|nr:hypothetical protein GQ53DRAFT_768188 [Thozetella sp. PMI_491]